MRIFGVVFFTVTSGLCTVRKLIAFQVRQGIGAAVLAPASLKLVVEAFDDNRRAHEINMGDVVGAICRGPRSAGERCPNGGVAVVGGCSW